MAIFHCYVSSPEGISTYSLQTCHDWHVVFFRLDWRLLELWCDDLRHDLWRVALHHQDQCYQTHNSLWYESKFLDPEHDRCRLLKGFVKISCFFSKKNTPANGWSCWSSFCRVKIGSLPWQFAQVAIFLPSFSDDPGAKISSQSDTRRPVPSRAYGVTGWPSDPSHHPIARSFHA